MPDFPFDLNNLLGFQFDQLKLALEYLARQQGDQQILINELLGRAPGAKATDFKPRTEPSEIGAANDEIKGDPSVDGAGMNSLSPKDFEAEDLDVDDHMTTPLQAKSQANRMMGELSEKMEKMQAMLEQHENRMVKLEH